MERCTRTDSAGDRFSPAYDAKETAAGYLAGAALREAELGYEERAWADANAAVKLAPNRDVRSWAALALARAGDTAEAEKLAAELDKAFPLDTLVQKYRLPTIMAAIALRRKDPNRAIELLNPPTGRIGRYSFLLPIYVRGAFSCCAMTMRRQRNFKSSCPLWFGWGTLPGERWPGLVWPVLMLSTPQRSRRPQGSPQRIRISYPLERRRPRHPIYKQAKAEYASCNSRAVLRVQQAL